MSHRVPGLTRPVRLIVNPSSGGGRAARALPGVEAELRRLGLTVATARTRSLEHVGELATEAAAAGEAAVVLSGDGCVGAVAGALAGVEGAVMGVLPGGRGNDFARKTGIPQDPIAACAIVAAGHEEPVDLGELDGRLFVGVASVGFDSDANRIANEAPSRLGGLVYAYGAVRALIGWRHAAFTVTVGDAAPRRFSGWSVAAANSGSYGGGMRIAPDASLHDGLLDVVSSEASTKAHFLRQLPKVFGGTHVHDARVRVERGASVRIEADRPFDVYADGDPIGRLPATVRCLPGAVRVLLPG